MSLAALLAGVWITTPLTALLRKEPPPKGKPRKDGELKQTVPGALRRSACRDADNDAPHHLASQGASPQGEAAKRRRIEADRYRIAFARRSACRYAENDTPHHLASQGASPQGEAAKRRRIETDRYRFAFARHSPQRGKQGTAVFLPIKKSSPRK